MHHKPPAKYIALGKAAIDGIDKVVKYAKSSTKRVHARDFKRRRTNGTTNNIEGGTGIGLISGHVGGTKSNYKKYMKSKMSSKIMDDISPV